MSTAAERRRTEAPIKIAQLRKNSAGKRFIMGSFEGLNAQFVLPIKKMW